MEVFCWRTATRRFKKAAAVSVPRALYDACLAKRVLLSKREWVAEGAEGVYGRAGTIYGKSILASYLKIVVIAFRRSARMVGEIFYMHRNVGWNSAKNVEILYALMAFGKRCCCAVVYRKEDFELSRYAEKTLCMSAFLCEKNVYSCELSTRMVNRYFSKE